MRSASDKEEREANQAATSTEDFVQYYNANIPDSFPKATLKALREFKARYSSLFKDDGEWTIDRHRKKLMDWLSLQ